MFKKPILVILCLMATQECYVVQPIIKATTLYPSNISEAVKCNINISSEITDIWCSRPFHPLPSNMHFFDYGQALCVTLFNSVEHLCKIKNVTNLQLEENNPTVKNVSALCSEMKSALNNSLPNTKLQEQKKWIITLNDKLKDEEECKNACFQKGQVVNPVCSTLLQINAYLISNIIEKHSTSETSVSAVKTLPNKNLDVSHVDSTNQSKDVNLVNNIHKDDDDEKKVKVPPVQESETAQVTPLIKHAPKNTSVNNGQTSSISKNEKDDKFSEVNIEGPRNQNREKQLFTTSVTTATTPIITSTTIMTTLNNVLGKHSSNIQNTDNNEEGNKPPSSNALETSGDSKINNAGEINEETALSNSIPDKKEKNPSPIKGEPNTKPDEPSPKSKDKDTNLDQTPTGPESEPILGVSINEHTDKTNLSPDETKESKTQNSDNTNLSPDEPKESKTQNSDNTMKKVTLSKIDDVEPPQAQSPDTEQEISDKDDGNTFNEDVDQNMGENQDTLDLDNPRLGTDEDDDEDMAQKINTLPEIDDSLISSPDKGTYINDKFVNAEDPHFFAYFMAMVIICIVGYLVYHNKQKILALALEGRSRRSSRRRPNTSGYRKLDSNLEEAVTSACSTSVTHVIY